MRGRNGIASGDYWLIVGLEACLFFCLPCWELTASWGKPLSHPVRFGAVLVAAASFAMLSCHVGPALFARQVGGRARWFEWLGGLWVAFGYLEWIGNFVVADGVAAGVFVGVVAGVGLWRPGLGAVANLVLGGGILAWANAATWGGVAGATQMGIGESVAWEWPMARGVLLSAAPVVMAAFRIGQMGVPKQRIWLSGVLGVWLPVLVSVTLASMAVEVGLSRHWAPSLPRGFHWALLGSAGRLERWIMTLALCTFAGPVLLFSERLRSWRVRAWLGIAVAVSILWPYGGLVNLLATPLHQAWAATLVGGGALLGVATVFWDQGTKAE